MLFILTGDVQSGKTRWLERLVAELAADGVESRGVLAPGVWRPRADGDDGGLRPPGSGEGAYEKLGIDNVLLPQGERLRFARRRDLAERDGAAGMGDTRGIPRTCERALRDAGEINPSRAMDVRWRCGFHALRTTGAQRCREFSAFRKTVAGWTAVRESGKWFT